MAPVWLLTYQRTGTHLLMDHLNQTGLFNPIFDEWLNLFAKKSNIPKWYPWYNRLDLTVDDRLKTLPPFSSVHWDHFSDFFKNEHKPLIEQNLPGLRYIRLRRKDQIALAVSIYIARKTDTWILMTPEEKERHKNLPVKFRRRMLFQVYLNHLRLFHCWDSYLEETKCLDLFYEDFENDLQGTLERTFDYLGINQKPDIGKTRSQKNEHPMKEVLYQALEDAVQSGLVECGMPPAKQTGQPIPLL